VNLNWRKLNINKVAIIIGTRPDIIKMWPVHDALKKYDESIKTILIHSGQHDILAQQAQRSFSLIPDYTCRVLDDDKIRLGDLVSRLISQFTIAFYEFKPDLVLVHGDTSTAFSAATAAFLQNIPVGHIEAGLRTSRFEYPFPEEGYRRAISRFTTLHFAPTAKSAQNLREENINKNVYVTGNTIVDSLDHILSITPPYYKIHKSIVLITCHRTESYGKPLRSFCSYVELLASKNPSIMFLWPVHSNPKIKETVGSLTLFNKSNITLTEPMDYDVFTTLLAKSDIVITDSGGVMEEAAVLGIPTAVLRDETERPEVLDVDNVVLTGYNFEYLNKLVQSWIDNPPKRKCKHNKIFGDGTAGVEIKDIINAYFNKKSNSI